MHKPVINILLADDDSDDRMIFKHAFEELKMQTEVSMVNDGIELMKYLHNQHSLPDVLFLDLNMPGMSGLECLSEIRAGKKLKDLSVAIYSTSSSEKDIENAFIKGANIYIKKPSEFGVLKKVLTEVITVHLQYQTCGLNKENFLLSI